MRKKKDIYISKTSQALCMLNHERDSRSNTNCTDKSLAGLTKKKKKNRTHNYNQK